MCEELISSSWEKNHMSNFSYTISIGQLGEQLTLNQWVLGSSPRWCTKKCLAEKQGIFLLCDIAEMRNPVHQRGREQHVRPVSVPAGSNSPVDCWKVRGSPRGLISGKGGCAPSPSGRVHASRKRSHSPRGDRSLKTLRRSVFLTRPLMVHQKNALLKSRAFFFYVTLQK